MDKINISMNINIFELKKLILCKYNNMYLDAKKSLIVSENVMKKELKNLNIKINVQYRIFGNNSVVNKLVKILDNIFKKLFQYHIAQIAYKIRNLKNNIIINEWLNIIKFKKSNLYDKFKYKYDIFVYCLVDIKNKDHNILIVNLIKNFKKIYYAVNDIEDKKNILLQNIQFTKYINYINYIYTYSTDIKKII